MNKTYNIVGDIGGRHEELMLLVDKLPPGELVLVGDLVDRGPKSAEIIEYCIQNQIRCVLGNHEHMMLDFIENTGYYDDDIWYGHNGGSATIDSYFKRAGSDQRCEFIHHSEMRAEFLKVVPAEHVAWLKSLPLYLTLEGPGEDKYLVTHAPVNPVLGLEKAAKDLVELNPDGSYTRASRFYTPTSDYSVLWNRGSPRRIKDVTIQIYGHNAIKKVAWVSDKAGNFAVEIDTSRGGKLSAISLPSKEVFEQEFIL